MSSTEPLDNEHEAWDDFWAERLRARAAASGQAPTEVIRGVTVKVPQDVPLSFEFQLEQARGRSDTGAYKGLLKDLFGVDVLDAWTAAGMGLLEFKVIVQWGMSHGQGRGMTFEQAADHVMTREEAGPDDGGKAPSSRTRSARSGGSGRSSKRTSTVSTVSTPTDSPV